MSLRWLGSMSNPAEAIEALDRAESIKSRAEVILVPGNYWDIEYVIWDHDTKLDRDEIIAIGTDIDGDYHDESFPIEWLFLDDESLKKAKEEEKERIRKEKEEHEARLKAEEDKIVEEKERAEYERLKEKFEG